MQCELPALKQVAQTLTALLGRQATVNVSKTPYRPGRAERVLTATYRGLDGTLGAVCLVDLGFAAYVGAALSMFPLPRAQESLRAGKLDEQLEENFHEVMNVISTILTRGDARERLDAVVPGVAGVPADAAAVLAKPRARLDLEVEITGYAKSRLTFLVA
jgi:hypothetical protein